jgi:rhodanese-related sulfurtransferase
MCGCTNDKLEKLPLPEVSEGMRGELGIDKNINESNIDNYLNREDSVYYDMRMLVDEANYEAIEGDSYLSGFVKGFEIVPYPYLSNVNGLPEAVGEPYKGKTLFTQQADGTYKANYEESLSVLEYFFPKDKNIFLMCGGGGYAGMTKAMLVSLGWDETKIYNTGGYWYYEGTNNVQEIVTDPTTPLELEKLFTPVVTHDNTHYCGYYFIPYDVFKFSNIKSSCKISVSFYNLFLCFILLMIKSLRRSISISF